jgi:hypothetical protein
MIAFWQIVIQNAKKERKQRCLPVEELFLRELLSRDFITSFVKITK